MRLLYHFKLIISNDFFFVIFDDEIFFFHRLSSVQSLDSSLLFSVLTLTNETKAQTARLQARHNIFRSREMMRSLTRNPARYTEQFYEAVSVGEFVSRSSRF